MSEKSIETLYRDRSAKDFAERGNACETDLGLRVFTAGFGVAVKLAQKISEWGLRAEIEDYEAGKLKGGASTAHIVRGIRVRDKIAALIDNPVDERATIVDWISVKDRLPESGDIVIAGRSNPKGGAPAWPAEFINDSFYAANFGHVNGNERMPGVTHWVPLPGLLPAQDRAQSEEGVG